ncbi:MAG: diguanylate cyclase domain-containing protein [Terracidiphilus sp.]
MDWSKLPDVGAVALLTCAFASVARRGQTSVSGIWLIGWIMIVIHFFAFMFLPASGNPNAFENFAGLIGLCALAWAGVLFMWASVPYRGKISSRLMFFIMLATNTLYIALISYAPGTSWTLIPAAALFGLLPLGLSLATIRGFRHPLRWILTGLYCALSVFLLVIQMRPGYGSELALDAVFFTVYFGCCIHFWFAYGRPTTGAFITISGFLAWAAVFVVAPIFQTFLPNLHLEGEVWNLPKYVVAVGMILLLLEDQLAHNKHLALHDPLTGLPNRRLFEDRLASALERARRTGSQAALLLIDLNHFKRVNDTFGHHTGDLLLERVGTLLSGRVRRSDTVARTGGDEFSVVLEEPTNRENAEQVSSALMELLNGPLELGENTVTVGASIGMALFPEDAPSLEALCIVADLRMYAEKYGSRSAEESMPLPPTHGLPSVTEQPTSILATD